MPKSISRRQFIKLSAGALGGVAALEMVSCGLAPKPTSATRKSVSVQLGKEVPSVCPYCAVGCGQIVTVADGKILDIQGNPNSPINDGTLCPKGAAAYQLAVNPNRWTTAKYRAPFSDHWEDISLADAMERTAQHFKQTRDENFIDTVEIEGKVKTVKQVQAIASLGGATIDDEWNYIHQKLMRALGIVSIENQARI
jgi:formate dehydrogenase major subunit